LIELVEINSSKLSWLNSASKSFLYSSKFLTINSKLTTDDIRIIRPFVSLGPSDLKRVVGKKIKKDINKNTPIFLNNLKK
jgi:sialic acid synthase SpsE